MHQKITRFRPSTKLHHQQDKLSCRDITILNQGQWQNQEDQIWSLNIEKEIPIFQGNVINKCKVPLKTSSDFKMIQQN